MQSASRIASLLILAVSLSPLGAASALGQGAAGPEPPDAEVLRYRWRLEGMQGLLARVFGVLPTTGDGVMNLAIDVDGHLAVRFEATSEKAGERDHWTYETLVDLDRWRTLKVRETYRFRKKQREKNFELAEREVIDVLSGLQQLRRQPTVATGRGKIWSDGKTYPVAVSQKRMETLEIGGAKVLTRMFELRGLRQPDQRFWKARAEVWLTADARALPVQMLYRQSLGRLRLTLIEPRP